MHGLGKINVIKFLFKLRFNVQESFFFVSMAISYLMKCARISIEKNIMGMLMYKGIAERKG